MPKFHCWWPERDETELVARDFEATSPQHAACRYAEDFHYRLDGWEHRDWPITVFVRQLDDNTEFVDEIEVEREAVPEFSGRRLRKGRTKMPLPEEE